MAHARAAIRATAIAGLTGQTAAEARVDAHALDPLADDGKPRLVVRTGDETAEPHAMGRDLRTLPLAIEAHARAKTPAALEAALDALTAEVEAAIDALGPDWGGQLVGIQYQGTETVRSAAGEDGAAGAATLTYQLQYETRATGAPV